MLKTFSWRFLVLLGGVMLALAILPLRPQSFIVMADNLDSLPFQLFYPTPFLRSPFYGTVRANCIFDHQYPIYTDEYELGEPISSTVMHFDGSLASSPIVIGTTSCYSGHSGVDYGMDYKTVVAASDGTVIESGWYNHLNHKQGYGLYVKISHYQTGYTTIYGHLSAVSVDMRSENPEVRQQDVIGISGNTGNSDGPHLHFEVRNSRVVNPYGWIGVSGNDPWQLRSGAFSINLWSSFPSITNPEVYTSGEVLDDEPNFPPVPTGPGVVLVEDTAAQTTGSCWNNQTSGGYNKGSFLYAAVITESRSMCSIQWSSGGLSGSYEIYAYIPGGGYSTSEGSIYTIHHAQGDSQAIVFQDDYPEPGRNSNQWAYLGRYQLDHQSYVKLSQQTQM